MRKVAPTRRFRIRRGRRLITEDESLLFQGRSHYYRCPTCCSRTLINWRRLDVTPSLDPWPYKGPPSPFPPELLSEFGDVPEHALAYDFYCKGCRLPVRLLFWIEERMGMGGPWYPVVQAVLEFESEDQ
jgi:hypothetical protein